ncbi:hypothetical protein UY3_14420 [Chelonia mydas]|uniref:Uncharacterized protein n=1 Tax=Chelonia mydas TaxID=8469 RepID=M7ASZ3_CHEMY|nr:hypothetical protein UY3_14420 [Chelonia mydas]
MRCSLPTSGVDPVLSIPPLASVSYSYCGLEGFTVHTRRMPETDEEKTKEEDLDDMYSEILQASDCEQRAWRVNIADIMETEKVDTKNGQELERKRQQQDIMGLLWQQTQML